MLRSKRGLAVLGLCAVALGAVVFSSAVQAEKGATWRVNGTAISGSLLPTVAISSIDAGDMVLLTTMGGQSVELLCKGAEFIGAALETDGKISSGNKTKFSGCVLKSKGTIVPGCQPHTGEESGVFTSNGLKGLIVLHETAGKVKETLIRFEPASGTVFATIQLGEECGLGEACVVSGVSTVREPGGAFGTDQVTHLVEQGPLSNLKVGASAATVDGSASLSLSGAHKGLTWSAVPA